MPQTIADYTRPSIPGSQTGKITFVIVLGFLVFVTLRGRLAAYVNLLFSSKGKTPTSPAPSTNTPAQSSIAPAPETGSSGGSGNTHRIENDVEIYDQTGQFLGGANSGSNGPALDGYY